MIFVKNIFKKSIFLKIIFDSLSTLKDDQCYMNKEKLNCLKILFRIKTYILIAILDAPSLLPFQTH